MTAPTHTPASMTPPSDIQPEPPDQSTAPAPERAYAEQSSERSATAGRMGGAVLALKAAAADNLMVAIFGPMIVLLLAYALYTTNDRFGEVNDRFGEVNDRFIALEASIDRRFAAQDAKIDALDAKFDEMNLKLTALIAALGKTDEVDAALAGEIVPP
ncbi:MAG: hypothetical protein OXG66_02575 [Acidimicrobiaceae bacterium]|nr:hypothetical protein [Acidimicrobiaceae bacterium]